MAVGPPSIPEDLRLPLTKPGALTRRAMSGAGNGASTVPRAAFLIKLNLPVSSVSKVKKHNN